MLLNSTMILCSYTKSCINTGSSLNCRLHCWEIGLKYNFTESACNHHLKLVSLFVVQNAMEVMKISHAKAIMRFSSCLISRGTFVSNSTIWDWLHWSISEDGLNSKVVSRRAWFLCLSTERLDTAHFSVVLSRRWFWESQTANQRK